MSTASLGSRRVGDVMTALSFLGYRCARISATGQRGARLDNSIGGHIIALSNAHGYPHLLIAVGGASRRLPAVFAELRASSDLLARVGCAPMVVRFIRPAARWFYVSEDQRFGELVDALDALRSVE